MGFSGRNGLRESGRVRKNVKAPIVAVTFGGALVCFSFVSHTVLVITVGASLVALGVYLLKQC